MIKELFFLISEEELQVLKEEFGDEMSLKFFLHKELRKIVSKKCEEIEISKPYIHNFNENKPA